MYFTIYNLVYYDIIKTGDGYVEKKDDKYIK